MGVFVDGVFGGLGRDMNGMRWDQGGSMLVESVVAGAVHLKKAREVAKYRRKPEYLHAGDTDRI